MPPPSTGDLGVARAGKPAPQLVATIARVDDVGVRIDEARQDRAARGVDDDSARRRLDQPIAHLRRSDKQQPAFSRRQRAVVDRGDVREVGADARGGAGAGQQRMRVPEHEVGNHAPSITEPARWSLRLKGEG